MSVTPIYLDNPKFNLNRGYIAGIALYAAVTGLSWDGQQALFHDPILNVDWEINLISIFSQWSSNYYTLDHAVDFPNSYARIAGVPVGAGCYVTFGVIINEDNWWIGLQPLSVISSPIKLLLDQNPAYWYPLAEMNPA